MSVEGAVTGEVGFGEENGHVEVWEVVECDERDGWSGTGREVRPILAVPMLIQRDGRRVVVGEVGMDATYAPFACHQGSDGVLDKGKYPMIPSK